MATVIVAIPANDDPVWKLSSEKIPHLTLLYLADSVDPEKLSGLVQHIAENCMTRPGLSVDKRGTLGPDNADVLFFDKKSYWCQDFAEIRRWLLTDPEIFTAFNSVDQYPSWTPHLTVGYPESSAHDDKVEFSPTWVRFDRLAIWYGDFEGPEFEIDDRPQDVMMADTTDFLAHYGVKGMKWGVRKKKEEGLINTMGLVSIHGPLGTHVGLQSPNNKIPKYDKKSYNEHVRVLEDISKQLRSAEKGGLLHPDSNFQKYVHAKRSPEYLNKVMTQKDVEQFNREVARAMTKDAQKLVPDGTKAFVFNNGPGTATLFVGTPFEIDQMVKENGLRHGDPEPTIASVDISFKLNDRGLIVGIEDFGIVHSDDISNFLMHFGVKGMRWGVRRDERPLSLEDKALNITQRSQVKIASTISALSSVGMATNAAAAIFQLQKRFERLKGIQAVIDKAEQSPLFDEASRSSLKATKNSVVKSLVASAAATTATSVAIGALTQRTAKAYFAPIHKVYGDVKPQINKDLRQLSKDIQNGKREKLSEKQYQAEVSKIVKTHMLKNRSNLLSPFHEIARTQLGTEFSTKSLDIKFSKLPNTDLYSKMTVTTPNGLKLVKAIKNVQHDDMSDADALGDLDFFFDYKFNADGFVIDFSCPTIEIADDIFEDRLDLQRVADNFDHSEFSEGDLTMSDDISDFLAHHGVKGMKWGVRKNVDGSDSTSGVGNYRPSRISKDRELNKAKDAAAQAYEKELKGRLKKIDDQEYNEKKTAIEGIIKNSKNPKNLDSSDKALIDSKRKELTKKYDKLRQDAIDKKTKTRQELDAAKLAAFDSVERRSRRERLLDNFISFGIFTGTFKGAFDLLTHEDETDDFLEHHGIKGMRWGVRRTDEQLGNPDGGANGVKSPSGVDVNFGRAALGSDGKLSRREKKQLIKAAEQARKKEASVEKDIDHPSDIKLSVDAERFVRTRLKEGHEMSDREIKEAIARKRDVDTYTQMFAPDANKALRDRLDSLQLQKSIREIDAELNPAKLNAAQKLIKGAQQGYEFYNGLPGPIRNRIEGQMSKVFDPNYAKKLAEEATKAADIKRKEDRAEKKADLEIKKLEKQIENEDRKNQRDQEKHNSSLREKNDPEIKVRDKERVRAARDSADAYEKKAQKAKDALDVTRDAARDAEAVASRFRKIADNPNAPAATRKQAREKADKFAEEGKKLWGKTSQYRDEYHDSKGKAEKQRKFAKDFKHSDLEDFLMHHDVLPNRKFHISNFVNDLMRRSSDV